MKVLMVEPGRVPYAADIDDELKALQAAVGGDIQPIYPYDDPIALICNEEGKYMGLPLNRALYDKNGQIYDIIAGNFFLCGLDKHTFADLPADLMEKYRQQFEHPEQFVRIAGKILAVKQPIPSPEEQAAEQAEMRMDAATDLAFDLDTFFRRNSPRYVNLFSDPHEQKERLADELLSGRAFRIRNWLSALERNHHFPVSEVTSFIERINAYEKEYEINTYAIYQLKQGDSTDQYRFMSYDWLERKELSVDCSNYRLVYQEELMPGDTLNAIYEKFNLDHPKDFIGHSLSVSDVVVIHKEGVDTAYYVDRIGFKEVPDFFKDTGQPETKRDVSLREQLDDAKKQATKAVHKVSGEKKEPERS